MQNNHQSNIQTIDLKGSIEHVVILNHAEYGDPMQIYELDRHGNIIVQKNFNKFDKLISDYLNEFDKDNLIIKKTDLITRSTWIYEYDSDKKLIKIVARNLKNRINNIITLEYVNNLLVLETVGSENDTCWKYFYEYDSMNRLIKGTEKNCNDELAGIVEYFYNENNQIILEKNYDEKGELSYSDEFKYNEKGDLIFQKAMGLIIKEKRFDYDYNDNNNWVRQYYVAKSKKELQFERLIVYY